MACFWIVFISFFYMYRLDLACAHSSVAVRSVHWDSRRLLLTYNYLYTTNFRQCVIPATHTCIMTQSDMSNMYTNYTRAVGTLIVGGGPVGYGAAAMLAQQGHRDIVLIERNESADWYDASKAYAYNIDFRGHAFLESIGIESIDGVGATPALQRSLFC